MQTKRNKLQAISTALVIASLIPVIATTACAKSAEQKQGVFAEQKHATSALTFGQGQPLYTVDIVSTSGIEILDHIAQARADIHDGNIKQAKEALSEIHRHLEAIRSVEPTTQAKKHISIVKKYLGYGEQEELQPYFVPLYASLDTIADLVPVNAAKAHIKKAESHVNKDQREAAAQELDEAGQALVYTEIDLPLSVMESNVTMAQKALSKNKPEMAEKALKVAEQSALFFSFGISEPVATASNNLSLARHNYEAGKYQIAKSDLAAAIKNMESAAESEDDITAESAQQLLQEAKKLEPAIDEKSSKETTMRLQALSEHAGALSEHELELMGIDWSSLPESSVQARQALAHAKLYLSYGEIDQFTLHDWDKAQEDLKQAQSYLQKIAEDKTVDKEVIAKLEKEVEALQKEVAAKKSNEDAAQQYADAVSQLRFMINKLL